MSSIDINRGMASASRLWTVLGVSALLVAGSLGFIIHRGRSSTDTAGMVLLPGGTFEMGSAESTPDHNMNHLRQTTSAMEPSYGFYEDESPVHRVTLSPFRMDRHEVTNAQFARFVAASGHVTDAEKAGESWMFKEGFGDWKLVTGADWRHPLGPEDSITDKMNHPVVHVSWNDAAAYARWAGKRLPTEAEWEYAARGGVAGKTYPWGDDLKVGGTVMANFWQGTWPQKNLLEDRFYYTAPVGSFSPNGFGLFDMIGNVWEWNADWYDAGYYQQSPEQNPKGPETGQYRVARGGSWFCSPNYCRAYRVAYRGRSPQSAHFNNVGFRCAQDAHGR